MLKVARRVRTPGAELDSHVPPPKVATEIAAHLSVRGAVAGRVPVSTRAVTQILPAAPGHLSCDRLLPIVHQANAGAPVGSIVRR